MAKNKLTPLQQARKAEYNRLRKNLQARNRRRSEAGLQEINIPKSKSKPTNADIERLHKKLDSTDLRNARYKREEIRKTEAKGNVFTGKKGTGRKIKQATPNYWDIVLSKLEETIQGYESYDVWKANNLRQMITEVSVAHNGDSEYAKYLNDKLSELRDKISNYFSSASAYDERDKRAGVTKEPIKAIKRILYKLDSFVDVTELDFGDFENPFN